LCQGEDTTSALVKRFAEDPETSLFGTLSLWQGVDVPGPSLSLVFIDRIPFPRPDDPLLTARQRAVAARGGNGFMGVAASHAASSRCWTRGWPPRATAAICARRCRRSGRRPIRRGCARRCNGCATPDPFAHLFAPRSTYWRKSLALLRPNVPLGETGRIRYIPMGRRHLVGAAIAVTTTVLVAGCSTTLPGRPGSAAAGPVRTAGRPD